jgi:hypothetical protein
VELLIRKFHWENLAEDVRESLTAVSNQGSLHHEAIATERFETVARLKAATAVIPACAHSLHLENKDLALNEI